jgi:hypothetical protein
MSDPTALLQHILSAVEQIKTSQQTLQQSHLELQSQVAASKVDLEAKFAALSLNLASPAPPPPLPETISTAALEQLVAHPLLQDRDRLFAQVLQFSQRLVTPDVDASILQAAYAELITVVTDTAESLSPAPTTPRASSGAPSASTDTYIARSGRRFDTRKPPPYPCHRCGHRHWVAGPGASPCPAPQTPFSRRGAHSPAPAPRRSAAGQK